MQGINWYVFTQEEQNDIKSAIVRGDRDNVACLIENVNMDLEKEAEIQKIINQMTPDDEDFVSEVEDEVEKDFLEGIAEVNKTPELEAEFQEKLDKERNDFIAKKKSTKKSKKTEEVVETTEESK